MPTETEELKLQVTLVDNATPAIKKLRDDLAQIGLGTATSDTRRKNKEMEESFRILGLTAKDSARLIAFGSGVVTGSLLNIGHQLERSIRLIPEWSDKMRAAGIAARSVGADPAQYEHVINKMREIGMTAEEAQKS